MYFELKTCCEAFGKEIEGGNVKINCRLPLLWPLQGPETSTLMKTATLRSIAAAFIMSMMIIFTGLVIWDCADTRQYTDQEIADMNEAPQTSHVTDDGLILGTSAHAVECNITVEIECSWGYGEVDSTCDIGDNFWDRVEQTALEQCGAPE